MDHLKLDMLHIIPANIKNNELGIKNIISLCGFNIGNKVLWEESPRRKRTFNSNLKTSKKKFLEIHSSKFVIIYTKDHSSYIYDGWLFCYDQIGPTNTPRAIHHIINYL